MKSSIENECARLWIENGILYFTYKENVVIRLEEVIRIVADRLKLQQGKPFPILCNTIGIKTMEKDARLYFATEGSKLTIAVALISDNPLSQILTNMYVVGGLPSAPTKIVANEKEGLEFLSGFTSPKST
ncbi:hypothetical protein KCTC52924_02953 [Arenibacter antarcticus]|uniref:DUF7793 domain-containing protein n=1 Tax=Arenibacter antarcticus TaxID=2040469 RepID=A0ABW5VKN9_9FLAO|nr:hypothetical protein [Arenibacter sp. H213]MCM4167371.1 hypothetical protein [Arenibacter sp. H213]